MPPPLHQKSFVLTVAESKRLIARALKRHPAVIRALNRGIVAVAKGTTNAYVYEELSGEGIDRAQYCLGVTRPSRGRQGGETGAGVPDLVLREGQAMEGAAATEIVRQMGPGDVFIKGANALNYDLRQAGILIGHPEGGTIGAAIGAAIARRATLLLAVGLEKNIPGDLHEIYRNMTRAGANGEGPNLWPVDGEIFTEIEAVQLISGARAGLIGAGGVGGAEGSVRISVWGQPDQVDRAAGAIEDVLGEPPLLGP